MTTQELLTSTWNGSTMSIVATILAAVAAGIGIRKGGGRSILPWSLAFLVFVIAVASPLATLSAGFLFTAHMTQHLLLLLIVPLLVIAGLRRDDSPEPTHNSSRKAIACGWIAGVGAMWLWHEPNLCSLSAISPTAFAVQTVSLLLAGYFFWRPVWGAARLRPGPSVVYLFTACLACTSLGIYITFVPITVCPAFAAAAESSPILRLIRDQWNFSAAADQQLGGLLMWVPACAIYLSSILAQFFRWHDSPALETTTS